MEGVLVGKQSKNGVGGARAGGAFGASNRSLPLRAPMTFSLGRDNLLNLVEGLLEPVILVLSLWACAAIVLGEISSRHMVLSLIVFAVTFPGPSRLRMTALGASWHILLNLALIFMLLVLLGFATRFLQYFNRDVIVAWFVAAPTISIVAHLMLRSIAPQLLNLHADAKRTVIIGMNKQGVELGKRIKEDRYSHTHLLGFFDDRSSERLSGISDFSLLGSLSDLPAYVKENRVQVIYLSLPMTTQKRILKLLEELRDTTASVYFVPDIFITDLIQARMDTVCGMPVVAVCDTPFSGTTGLVKRASDIVLSLLILVLISPLLAALAIAVKLTSPGPVIFKQRRYGLDGEEIVVYKFRSMTVCEDGGEIQQAQKNDQRVTPLGAFMRRTSLDELPQFINVLQGRMSIVGPRPHAVAHNELYRKAISGYMVRHKVKPGITGWAQVCGYRGETETLDKMQARIDHDLEYLRNWSLRLDLFIIFRTVWVILKGQKGAY